MVNLYNGRLYSLYLLAEGSMEYDPNEIATVRDCGRYREQLDRSKENAAANTMQGITLPRKIVDDQLIEFYGAERGDNNDQYGKWLSNCVYARIVIDGEINNSSEHYYQREKFRISREDPNVIKWCKERRTPIDIQLRSNQTVRDAMAILSPVQVAKFGQSTRDAPIRGDWEDIKNMVMWKALVAKFTQNPTFAEALKNTYPRILIERAPTDKYWAINNAGTGENTLGVMLMVLRDMLMD